MRKKFLALSLAVIVSAAQVMTVSASKQEQLQQQQLLQSWALLHAFRDGKTKLPKLQEPGKDKDRKSVV